jgi:hypothetical protein
MAMSFIRTIFLLMTFTLVSAAYAQAPADFSGTWELNTKRGENLGMMAAVQETMIITQNAEQIVSDYTDVFGGKTTTRQVTYDLGGGVVENFAAMGDPSTTVSQWEGASLVTKWTAEGSIAGTEMVRTETRTLSDDGQSLSVAMARDANPPMVFVYEKQ